MAGPSSPAVWRGFAGSAIIAAAGLGAGAVPTDGGPAGAVGLIGATFGHGETLALVLCWCGLALLITAWLSLGRLTAAGRLSLVDAVWASALWAVPFLGSVPVFSRDAWSYLAQGALLGAGISPYEYGPNALPGVFTNEVSPDWRSTATPYGPVHLWIMRAVVALSGDRPYIGVIILRVLVFAALAGICVGVISLARKVNVSPAFAVWASTASPLSVLHFAGGLHNEVFVLVAALGAVNWALNGQLFRSAIAIGLALAVKVTALLVAPFLLWLLLESWRARCNDSRGDRVCTTNRSVPARVRYGYFAVLATVPLAVVSATLVVSGTGLGMLGGLIVSDQVVNYLSLPTALAHLIAAHTSEAGFDEILRATRHGGRIVLIAVLVTIWWRFRHTAGSAVRGIVAALIAFVLLNSLSWPWYHAWIGVFWAAARPSRWANGVAVGAVVFLTLSIGPDGSTSLYSAPLAVLSAAAALVTVWWWLRTPSTGLSGSLPEQDHRVAHPPVAQGGTHPR